MCSHSLKVTDISFNIHFRYVTGKYFESPVISFCLLKVNYGSHKSGLVSGKNRTFFDNMNVTVKESKDIFTSNWLDVHMKIVNISVIDITYISCSFKIWYESASLTRAKTYQNHFESLFRFVSKFRKTLLIKWCEYWMSPKLLSGDIYILSKTDMSTCCCGYTR